MRKGSNRACRGRGAAGQVRFGLRWSEAVTGRMARLAIGSPCTGLRSDQASGKDVAALTSMPLMKIAATKVEIDRTASELIECLLIRLLRRNIAPRITHY